MYNILNKNFKIFPGKYTPDMTMTMREILTTINVTLAEDDNGLEISNFFHEILQAQKIVTTNSAPGTTLYEHNLMMNFRYFLAIAHHTFKLTMQKLSIACSC